MDCSNAEELIERLTEAQGAFECAGSSTRQDERVNDGANYAGLMSSASYKEKRKEMTVKEDVQANRDAKMAAARAQITADRDAKDAAAQVPSYPPRVRAPHSSWPAMHAIRHTPGPHALVGLALPQPAPSRPWQEREAREVRRKEKIKQELAASIGDAEEGRSRSAAAGEARQPKKKLKKASATAGALSFDADGEDA
jgi:hypothetical protein